MRAETLVGALAETLPEGKAGTVIDIVTNMEAEATVDALADALAEVEVTTLSKKLAEVKVEAFVHAFSYWPTDLESETLCDYRPV